jgi:multiple antibiotic resistance protein
VEITLSFLNLVFVGFFALIPPVNPVGTALVVEPFLHRLNREERRAAAGKITLYCFLVCTGALLIGSWIFQFFGISLPVVQIAGGILICRMGWQLLASGTEAKGSHESSSPGQDKNTEDMLFYPLAFPMTTGAGTISVILTLTAHSEAGNLPSHLVNLCAVFFAIVIMCVFIYICYAFTPALLGRLGPRGEQVVNSLSAYLVFCVGIQIATTGAVGLIRSYNAAS